MSVATPKKAARPRYEVGDQVTYLRGLYKVDAVIVENRGPLGIAGRHVYGIRFQLPEDEPRYTEVPEEDLEPGVNGR